MERTVLPVTGMACEGCEQNVIDALEALEGISSATATHEADEVRVEYDGRTLDEAAISSAIENAGYEVTA